MSNVINRLNKNHTLLTKKRLIQLKDSCSKFKKSNRQDLCFVECGVANGGALALMKSCASDNTVIYAFDSWDKMPNLTSEDENEQRALKHNFNNVKGKYIGRVFGKVPNVHKTFRDLNVKINNVKLIKGYFEDTFPKNISKIKNIAVLHIDVDFYKATQFCLESLYDKVISGGVVIVDDYNAYIGCKKAVDEFRKNHKINDELILVKESAVKGKPLGVAAYWVKN